VVIDKGMISSSSFASVAVFLIVISIPISQIATAFLPSNSQNKVLNSSSTHTFSPSPSPVQPVTQRLEQYNSSSLGFSLQLPSDWKAVKLKNGIQFMKEKNLTFLELRADDLKSPSPNLKQYVDEYIAKRVKSRQDFKLIANISQDTFSGSIPAYKATYTFLKTEEPGKGTTEKILRFWLFLGQRSYSIAYVSSADTFEQHLATAQQIIHSLKFDSPNGYNSANGIQK